MSHQFSITRQSTGKQLEYEINLFADGTALIGLCRVLVSSMASKVGALKCLCFK